MRLDNFRSGGFGFRTALDSNEIAVPVRFACYLLTMHPRVRSPMLATSAKTLSEGPDWSYEVKWDGYRAIASKRGADVRLYSRNLHDFTRTYPSVAGAVSQIAPTDAVIDGEIVAVD